MLGGLDCTPESELTLFALKVDEDVPKLLGLFTQDGRHNLFAPSCVAKLFPAVVVDDDDDDEDDNDDHLMADDADAPADFEFWFEDELDVEYKVVPALCPPCCFNLSARFWRAFLLFSSILLFCSSVKPPLDAIFKRPQFPQYDYEVLLDRGTPNAEIDWN